ncbi:BadF/BadG/BcrA/BcrD ATPase family protein [Catellatospora sp. KI3]|uniref:N-acetylglucosamine kinase n=1 Tax=Catellatospora sp. KI3 TaxID=3041620 RepID=UPI0024823CE2|nr:BadF/BadG/BcrA/BcrD ATPase family protein [Catellatospora sp. KI3]MDI1460532.1 BadF/BadG/BcrA/BcrD ATPase family protein [Catellatospora sp. KI3]
MNSTELFLAVDGGNSKTDVVLADTDGRVHGFVRGPGSSPQTLGVDAAVKLVDGLVSAALRAAEMPPTVPVARAEVYLSGVDLPIEVDVAAAAIAATGWAESYRVDNDTFALMRAGTDSPDAVAVVCGAGINCVGRAADGRTARFPALGMIAGDWGGGQHLASLAMWHAARGEDGRGPATALAGAVAAHFGRGTVLEVIAGVHLGELPSARLDSLSEVLFAVAAAGDGVARRVVARQASEITAMVTVAADRLGLRDLPYEVVLGGGVLRAGHALLNDAVYEGVKAHSSAVRLAVVAAPPVVGAGLFALDALGATSAAAAGLRAALATARPQLT